MTDNYLQHFGVKGMKWGVRKKRVYHPDSSRSWTKKEAYELSDAELNRRINRINKEQEYRNKTENPALRAGKEFLKKAVIGSVIGATGALVGGVSRDVLMRGANAVDKILDPIKDANFDELLGFKN